jgi:hypothetical protein
MEAEYGDLPNDHWITTTCVASSHIIVAVCSDWELAFHQTSRCHCATQEVSNQGRAVMGAVLDGLYLPKGTESRPAIVAVHGGAWQVGSRDI